MFKGRREWFQHELDAHRRFWSCPSGCLGEFGTSQELFDHIVNEHPLPPGAQIEKVIRFCSRPQTEAHVSKCPLCSQTFPVGRSLRRHLGGELEEIALFVMPRPYDFWDGSNGSDGGSDDGDSHSDAEDDPDTQGILERYLNISEPAVEAPAGTSGRPRVSSNEPATSYENDDSESTEDSLFNPVDVGPFPNSTIHFGPNMGICSEPGQQPVPRVVNTSDPPEIPGLSENEPHPAHQSSSADNQAAAPEKNSVTGHEIHHRLSSFGASLGEAFTSERDHFCGAEPEMPNQRPEPRILENSSPEDKPVTSLGDEPRSPRPTIPDLDTGTTESSPPVTSQSDVDGPSGSTAPPVRRHQLLATMSRHSAQQPLQGSMEKSRASSPPLTSIHGLVQKASTPIDEENLLKSLVNPSTTAPAFLSPSTEECVFQCTYPGCNAVPFQTQYLLNSHTNVHSQNRPHFCPVEGCPRAIGGRGFKRKNEMIRHGLVHDSPGYACPFCADQQHKYPRPDNLQR